MDFKEYVDFSVHEDVDFADEFSSEIGTINTDYGWVRLDAEIELLSYDQKTKEAVISVNWIAESKNFSHKYYGTAKVKILIEGKGQKPAKISLIELIEARDDDGLL